MTTLKIILLEAENIPKVDLVGWADPFCFLQVSGKPEILKSKIISNSKNPIWDERFEFKITNKNSDVLHILLKDKDGLSADDPIAKVEIPLRALELNQPTLHWFPMVPVKGIEANNIRIRLILELFQ